MAVEKDRLWLFAAAASLRILLCTLFPQLPELLDARVEVSTPMTSFKRLQEGVYLYANGHSPYDGGIYHQAALLLPIFSILPDYRTRPLPSTILYILTDLLSAHALMRIADSGESTSNSQFTSSKAYRRWSSAAVGSAFLFNPFAIATCLGRSTNVFTNCAILQAIAAAGSGYIALPSILLGLASYLSLHPVLLAPPLALLAYNSLHKQKEGKKTGTEFTLTFLGGVVSSFCLLAGLSWLLDGRSWRFLSMTYGVRLSLTDLTPNIGLWWYFFTEMFDSFRDFFLGVFWLHMVSYVGGMTIRLRQQPLFVITSLLGLFAVFQPYPSISDTTLYFSLLPLYRHVFPHLRYGFVATAALLYSTFLGPAFFHTWIYAGSGNANFFYAITLVWSLGLIIVIADMIFAVLRDEFDVERPEMRNKPVVRI